MIDPHMSNDCMKERLSTEQEVSKSKIHAKEAFERTFSLHIHKRLVFCLKRFNVGLSFSTTWHIDIVGHPMKCILTDIVMYKNLWFSILYSFHQRQAFKFLLVDSCRARAQLSRAVLKTSWFQKLTNILSSARSIPKKATTQN